MRRYKLMFVLLSLVAFMGVASIGRFDGEPKNLSPSNYVQIQAPKRGGHAMNNFFIDKTGNTIIDANKYEAILSFSEGLARVRDGRGWGFIDKQGNEVIEPRFPGAGAFSEGLAAVQVEGLWGYIDRNGQMVIEPQYEIANEFSEGLAVVVKDKIRTVSTVNRQPSQSTVVVSHLVQRRRIIVGGSSAELSASETAESATKALLLINKSGQTVLTFTREDVQFDIHEGARFSEGLINAYDRGTGKVGFMDKTGNFVIQPIYRQAAAFSEGLARVAVLEGNEEKLGFIDHKGRFVIPPRFNTDADFSRNSTDFSETLASLSEGLRSNVVGTDKSVYINTRGEIVLVTDFSYSGPFRDGAAVAYDAKLKKWGYIDKSGMAIISPRFDRARDFHEGLAAVTVNSE